MPPMRRPMGQGTIVPWTPTPTGQKRWRIAVTMAGGKRVWRVARSPREAERIRRELVDARELDLDPSRQTVAGFLRSWIAGLEAARNQRVRPRTLDGYRSTVENHIIPGLDPDEALTLSRLTVARVQAWLDADPMAPRTVNHHRAVLRRALNVAMKQRLVQYNAASLAEPPAVEDDDADPFTADEARRILEATRGDRLHALWRLAFVTGFRIGELLGLAWEDVAPGSITFRHQLQRLSVARGGDVRGWALTEPKAARRLDTIAIDADTAAVLAAHRLAQAAERRPDWRYFGLVFVTEDGNPYHQSVTRKAFLRACDAAGVRRRRPHDMRHTANRLMKDAGVEEDVRMARLGHNTTAMSRKYGGASEAMDRLAVDALGRVLAG